MKFSIVDPAFMINQRKRYQYIVLLIINHFAKKYAAEKRLRIDIGALKGAIKNNAIEHISWVKTNEQLTDSLTKSGASSVTLVNVLREGEFGPAVIAYLFSISKDPE